MSYSYSLVILFTFTCNIINVLSDPGPVIVPCRRNDELCMTKSANIAARLIAAGIPSLNIEPIDIIKLDNVVGNNSKLHIKITKSSISGLDSCEISNVHLKLDVSTLQFNLICPSIVSKGHYEVSGELVNLAVETNGPYEVMTGKYLIGVDANIKKVEGNNKDVNLAIKTFKVAAIRPLETVKLDYKNLSPKRKETDNAVRKFEAEKYKEMVPVIVPIYLETAFKIIFKNVNKLLETIPFDDLFID